MVDLLYPVTNPAAAKNLGVAKLTEIVEKQVKEFGMCQFRALYFTKEVIAEVIKRYRAGGWDCEWYERDMRHDMMVGMLLIYPFGEFDKENEIDTYLDAVFEAEDDFPEDDDCETSGLHV